MGEGHLFARSERWEGATWRKIDNVWEGMTAKMESETHRFALARFDVRGIGWE